MGVVLYFVLWGSSGRKLHRSGQQRPDAPAAQSWVAAHGGCRLLLLLLLLAGTCSAMKQGMHSTAQPLHSEGSRDGLTRVMMGMGGLYFATMAAVRPGRGEGRPLERG